MKYFLCLILSVFSLVTVAAEQQTVPSLNKIKEAKSLISEVVSDQMNSYNARQITADKVADAIFELLKDAEQPETEYVILNMAQEFYLEGRFYEKAIEMLELRQEKFVDTDMSNGEVQILSLWLKNTLPKEYDTVLNFFNQKFEAAIIENNVNAAESLYKLISPLTMKFYKSENYPQTQALQKLYLKNKNNLVQLKTLYKSLEARPSDPKLNREYGEILIQVKGDWEQALPYLIKGDQKDLAKMADTDVKRTPETEPDVLLKLADFYWDYGDKNKELIGRYYKMRATDIYEVVSAELSGLKLKLVERRIEEMQKIKTALSESASIEKTNFSKRKLKPLIVKVNNDVSIEFMPIPKGTFMMGSPEDESNRGAEKQHKVTITQNFWMMKYEFTGAQWQALWELTGGDKERPYTGILRGGLLDRYIAFMQLCDNLTQKERKAKRLPKGYVYRLPTEAEWEYACRAGTTTSLNSGKNFTTTMANCECPNLDEVANYFLNRDKADRGKIGQKKPNAWGLYDMHGNAAEMVLDNYRDDYENLPSKDPVYLNGNDYHIVRGESMFFGDLGYYRSAARPNPRVALALVRDSAMRMVLAPEIKKND